METESNVEVKPVEPYEPPALLDLEDVTSEQPCCDTSGGSCEPPL